MNYIVLYNESKYILKYENADISIGNIQENILKTCSLMIYNIENTELILKNGKSLILGSNESVFQEKLENVIKNNFSETILENDDYLLQIDKFIVYDRKRDEHGNVIKNNIIIDNYNKWFQENENQKYLSYSSVNKNDDVPLYQNNSIISLFSNIFETSLSNDSQYINNLFMNYVNVNSETTNNIINHNDLSHNDISPNNNVETINNIIPINIIEPNNNINNNTEYNINNDEFGNMVNIFDTYINNSETEQITNNLRNGLLYGYFNNLYNNVSTNNNTTANNTTNNDKINDNIEDNENSSTIDNSSTADNNTINNEDDIRYVNEFITENNINSFIENAPIFNIFRQLSANIEIDEANIIESNDEYLTFNIPISIYNNGYQSNFEDVIVSLTEDQFSELNCYEYNEENEGNECNICIECFNKEDIIVKLNCKHEFHKNCIKKWLCDNSTKCPVCRVEVAKGKANL
jgi:hypothetical protein